jgi:hypothetical protein
MKKLTVLLSVVFAAGLAYAGDTKEAAKDAKAEVKAEVKDAKAETKDAVKDAKADTKEAVKDAKAAVASHDVEAEVVSVDSTKNTITVKTDKGPMTAPVEGKAIAEAKNVKPGQKITLVCRDEKGEHKAVTEIKTPAVAKPAAEKPAEKK